MVGMAGPARRVSSDRERRLWIWTAAVLVAIYSTLGPARTVSESLREHNLLRLSIAAALLAVLGPVGWRWLRGRPDLAEVAAMLAVGSAYLMVAARIESWEERTHLFEYGIVAALIHMALLERRRNGRPVPVPAALTVTATAVFGFVDEIIQFFLPDRVFDLVDVGFNVLAGFLVVAARLAIPPQPRPGWRVWFLWLMAGAVGWGWGVYWGWYDNTEPTMWEAVPDVVLSGYLGLASGAVAMGVLQWLVLRAQLERPTRWIAAALGALAVVGGIVFGVGAVDEELGWFVGVGAFGGTVGLLQWAVLRRQVPWAWVWVPISAGAWVVGLPLGDAGGPPALGAVYGVITATTLVVLLRSRR